MVRKFLTNGQKLNILADVNQRLAEGQSLKSLALKWGVQPVQLRKWRAKQGQLGATTAGVSESHDREERQLPYPIREASGAEIPDVPKGETLWPDQGS